MFKMFHKPVWKKVSDFNIATWNIAGTNYYEVTDESKPVTGGWTYAS